MHVDGTGTRLERPQTGIDGGVERALTGVAGGGRVEGSSRTVQLARHPRLLAIGDEALQLATALVGDR